MTDSCSPKDNYSTNFILLWVAKALNKCSRLFSDINKIVGFNLNKCVVNTNYNYYEVEKMKTSGFTHLLGNYSKQTVVKNLPSIYIEYLDASYTLYDKVVVFYLCMWTVTCTGLTFPLLTTRSISVSIRNEKAGGASQKRLCSRIVCGSDDALRVLIPLVKYVQAKIPNVFN